MSDDIERLNEITARFREAGFDLRLYESVPGAWDAIWHPHERLSGLTSTAGRSGGTTSGASIMEAATSALEKLEMISDGGQPVE